MTEHDRDGRNHTRDEFDEIVNAAHGEMRIKYGGVELLPESLKGKQHHRKKINGVTMSYDVSQDTWWWVITFDGSKMPIDYRTVIGDDWVIQQARVERFSRECLFGIIPNPLSIQDGFVIRVREREEA